ncbi:IS1 family transposase [Saccharolobus solfataricus]|uniref:IS1 family transposase n=1 Tax=Saccharolobus solfataricus TaxID=2287 RepID=A0A3G8DYI5_SACSO|nr:IS1 family transposase [Saccharolobus solfataricus]AYN75781.1 IS1 family transposase [Saccharolobus solfataricus]AYP18616.1 IS1 family transposase [Saccharolobus solfataricus]AZF69116.1 IS1 family transposase [Saccharolobus solfataricus]AZF71736.1 IS1 family transposase [Saccharolobus solfataricus]
MGLLNCQDFPINANGIFHYILGYIGVRLNYTSYYCVYQALDNRVASKKYIAECHNSWFWLVRPARDTKARSERIVEYSLTLLNIM